jgi:DNA polymerase-3 subunit alpha
MKFIPLHVHSHYSLLEGLSKPHKIAQRCVAAGYKTCALTDKGSISGSISFLSALKDVCVCSHQKNIHQNKKGKCSGCKCEEFISHQIKPILGCSFYNEYLEDVIILAKDKDGWTNLIKATSEANKPELIKDNKPTLPLPFLANFSKNSWICISGHLGSGIGNLIFGESIAEAYLCKSYDEAKSLVREDWKRVVVEEIGKYQELFGKENFYLGVQLVDAKQVPASEAVAKIIRWAAKKTGAKCIASCNSFYPDKQDDSDHRILVCNRNKTTLSKIEHNMPPKDYPFWRSKNYCIPDNDYIIDIHTEEEINNLNIINEICSSYNILGKPVLPLFDCPDGLSQDDYLKKLCRDGWKKKLRFSSSDERQVYTDRIKRELDTLVTAGLSSYFLIVADYCEWARNQGWLLGPGRGSGAGCLVSYLIGITDADPIPANLIFERFYNAGRNTPDRISLPDIDTDFPQAYRPLVKEYIRNKYGKDRVADMITFGTYKGRGAITTVLSVHEACSFDEIKKISKAIPQEASISDHLQLMLEAHGESSTILWTLQNIGASLRDWCFINEVGELDGPMAKLFEQAIRLEGTKKSQGKHASGIIISKERLSDVCPMAYDKNDDQLIAGMEMNDLEAGGHTKYDLLGVTLIDKVMGIQNRVRTGNNRNALPVSYIHNVDNDEEFEDEAY